MNLDAMNLDAGARRWRWPLTLFAAVVVFVAVFAAVVNMRNRGPAPAPGYDARSRRAFVAECVNNAGPSYEPVCECAFDRIAETVPYDRYLAINESATRRRTPSSMSGSTPTPAATSETSALKATKPDDEVSNVLAGCLSRKIRGSTPAPLPDPSTSMPRRAESPATLVLNPDDPSKTNTTTP